MSRQQDQLSGVEEAYISELANCLAPNHTLVNPKDTNRFLTGQGTENAQVLEFVANKQVKSVSLGLLGQIFPGGLSAKVDYEGSVQFVVTLRREKAGEHQNFDGYAFKVNNVGRPWIPDGFSQCERLRTKWTVFDSGLDFEFISEKDWLAPSQ